MNINKESVVLPVILAGGSGSRLWPLSRKCFPKQYLNISNINSNTLLQNTFLRLDGIKNLSNPLIICNEDQRFVVAEQMREIQISPKSIVLEPVGRNTAPAIALAAILSLRENKDDLLLVLAADHEIKNKNEFIKKIEEGILLANEGRLVTFGVVPDKPETGYGYIEAFEELKGKITSSRIRKFIEKPELDLAKQLIQDKRYLWNSGIFLFKSSTILNEIRRIHPEIVEICEKSLQNNLKEKELDFQRLDVDNFKCCPNIPIDIAVMEKTKLGTVLSLDAGWSDIGNWKSVWENSQKDINGNSKKGKVLSRNTKNCYLRSEHRLLVGLNIKDLIVIETRDAVLIADKNSAQSVKDLVSELLKKNIGEAVESKKMHRPWGNFISLEDGETWQVKILEIKAGASLSLQLHFHRAEHWVVVDGTAKIEVDGKTSILSANESIYVPLGSKHRLSNPGKLPLVLIEVQSGNYLGEDDIVRFQDNYGRNIQNN